jgi:hypothetical protein
MEEKVYTLMDIIRKEKIKNKMGNIARTTL